MPAITTPDPATAAGAHTPQAPSFAIVGTGRSGSGFISRVLRAAGVNCGHEEWWGPTDRPGQEGLHGDSSWLAVPRLDEFRGPVLHQVRHPLDVIRSLVGIRMFSDPSHGAFRWFMFANLPGLTGDDMCDAMRWYVEWNRRCEGYALRRYRVEDVDADLVVEIGATVGHTLSSSSASEALALVGNHFNARRRADLSWDDLPGGPLREELVASALRYGYDVPV